MVAKRLGEPPRRQIDRQADKDAVAHLAGGGGTDEDAIQQVAPYRNQRHHGHPRHGDGGGGADLGQIGEQRDQDIAALHIDMNDLPAIQVGRSRDLLPGQWLMALGHPWGVPDALTAGIVIGTGRELPQMNGRDWLALDMAMRPGHSGGPVVTPQGEMVGINTLITGPQVSFAVPVDAATLFLKESLGSRVSASITRV